jgi:hypothetical protein
MNSSAGRKPDVRGEEDAPAEHGAIVAERRVGELVQLGTRQRGEVTTAAALVEP